ncbi:MAG: BspA family leucine-rich repeat surface protein [Colwellia sp.]|uniref:BspA family leucine-rich repeat surface protein n=1 Tax=Colwellia sp. TaxID=56799 RepID=UPI0025B805D9|nr:BspA family leucine-rich repeat surface protein [Colwellia sp.]NQZ27018.1 BspA family leucine-rich repeat surface protein [Colwellia sp.]
MKLVDFTLAIIRYAKKKFIKQAGIKLSLLTKALGFSGFANCIQPIAANIKSISIKKSSHTAALLLTVSVLSACGGGGQNTPDNADTTAPKITLKGENTISHNAGHTYNDLGATAIDNIDGDITVTLTGAVDSNVIGTYTLTYSATDDAGNENSLIRTVNVADLAGPVITLNGGNNITLAQYFTYNELGATAFDYVDGDVIVGEPTGELDHNTLGQYQLTYSATDLAGNVTTVIRTIEVVNLRPFISTWKTDNEGLTDDYSIMISTDSYTHSGSYNYRVDWGDGISTEETGDANHSYDEIGTYTVKITGDFPQIYFHSANYDNNKILSVEQWGDIEWLSMYKSFYYCTNLVVNAEDAPILDQVTNLSSMFWHATNFNQNINHWDVSSVTDMNWMFSSAASFNQGLNAWDVSSVTDMSGMFHWAKSFNQELNTWDVSSVTDMSSMFDSAWAFNQDLNEWDVSAVTTMTFMFITAVSFNQELNAWDVSSVKDMSFMFWAAHSFNQELNAWDVSSVTDMSSMFSSADSFNQALNAWDVSSVTDMSSMFRYATAFNQDLSAWDVSFVIDMENILTGSEFSPINFSITNYDKLLNSWSLQDLQGGVEFDVDSQYSPSSQAARDILTYDFGWDIEDGGSVEP